MTWKPGVFSRRDPASRSKTSGRSDPLSPPRKKRGYGNSFISVWTYCAIDAVAWNGPRIPDRFAWIARKSPGRTAMGRVGLSIMFIIEVMLCRIFVCFSHRKKKSMSLSPFPHTAPSPVDSQRSDMVALCPSRGVLFSGTYTRNGSETGSIYSIASTLPAESIVNSSSIYQFLDFVLDDAPADSINYFGFQTQRFLAILPTPPSRLLSRCCTSVSR